MKKLLIPFLFVGLLLNACKKDDTVAVKPSENPVASLVADADWVVADASNGGKYELGYVFSTTTKGKLTQVAAQMISPGIYTVSVWDADTKALLRQKSIEQSSPNKFSTATVEDLVIEKDKKYVVSINNTIGGVAKGYNSVKKKVASATTIFPISKGSIIIQKSVYGNGGTIIFPNVDYSTTNAFYGFADITFIPD
jgi:Domain of unknown function (DUF4082)